jgi:phosphomethylpyrimidine synthase
MIANPKFLAATAHVDEAAVAPLPNSRKIHVTGSRPDLRVPMREITQSETPASFGAERNPAIYVYDTSGPYTDPQARIDIRSGLQPLRARWIDERGDTEELPQPELSLWSGAARRSAPARDALQLETAAAAGQGRQQRHSDALRAARRDHAGDGVHRLARELSA